MTSKEALELLELILNNHSVMLEVSDNRMECLNVIKERLEVLEQENKKLKEAVTMLYLVAKLYDFEVYNNLDEKDKNLLNEVLCNA